MVVVSSIIATGVAVAGAIGIAGVTGGIIAFGIGIASNILIGMAIQALMPKPQMGGGGGAARGYQVNSRGAALDHAIIYGRTRVGGVVVFDETTGTENKYLHRVIAVAGHEVESFDELWINDEVATIDGSGNVISPSRYNGFMRINLHLGASNQTADTDLVSESGRWTSAHRLRGMAYMYVRFMYDGDVYPNGVPTITATVKGKKLYNPATQVTEWSENPALCLRDYLTTSGYGLGEAVANIDDDLVVAAIAVCNETDVLGGGPRFTCNGSFVSALTPYELLNNLLTSMGGTLWYSQGKWRMKPAYWTESVLSLTEDDLRSSISVSTRHSRRENFNTVKGTFRGAESNWQTTDYPEVTNAAFVTADNGQVSTVDVDLPFTDNSIEARRIARIALEGNRQQLMVSASFGLRAVEVQVGDVITLSNARFGWVAKEFQVISWTFGLAEGLDLQVDMTLKETAQSVFDELDDGISYELDNTSLLSPFEVSLPSLDAAVVSNTVNNDGTTISQIAFSWSVVDSSIVDYFDFQWKLTSDVNWRSTDLKETKFVLAPAISGAAYNYRVRSVNHLGVHSAFASAASPASTGDDSTVPKAPTSLAAVAGAESIKLNWVVPTQNTDNSTLKDLYQHKIYRNSSNNFGTATLIGRISGDVFSDTSLVGGDTYYYWVTALDYTGNESANSVVASATAAVIETERQNGVYYIGVASLPTTSSLANSDFVAAIGTPVDRDQAWFYTGTLALPTSQGVWIYNLGTTTWVEQTQVIDGSLIVTGTITADRLEAQSLSALGLTIGSLSDNATGERITISDSKILVYDALNVIRVKIGDLT